MKDCVLRRVRNGSSWYAQLITSKVGYRYFVWVHCPAAATVLDREAWLDVVQKWRKQNPDLLYELMGVNILPKAVALEAWVTQAKLPTPKLL